MTREGFFHEAPVTGVGLIPWNNIDGAELGRCLGLPALSVRVRNADRLLSRLPGWKRQAIRFHSLLTGSSVSIFGSATPRTGRVYPFPDQ
ncbi:MAG: hypothetical protein AB1497_08280 [Bacillota bacterium]